MASPIKKYYFSLKIAPLKLGVALRLGLMCFALFINWSTVALQCCVTFLLHGKLKQLHEFLSPFFVFLFHLGHHRALQCRFSFVVVSL